MQALNEQENGCFSGRRSQVKGRGFALCLHSVSLRIRDYMLSVYYDCMTPIYSRVCVKEGRLYYMCVFSIKCRWFVMHAVISFVVNLHFTIWSSNQRCTGNYFDCSSLWGHTWAHLNIKQQYRNVLLCCKPYICIFLQTSDLLFKLWVQQKGQSGWIMSGASCEDSAHPQRSSYR